MKQNSLKIAVKRLQVCILAFILTILSFFVFSFRVSYQYYEQTRQNINEWIKQIK